MRATYRQSGWSVLEVSVASAIGVLVLGASIALSATATEGTTTISKQAALRRESKVIFDEFREQLAESGMSHIDVYTLANGMSAVTYQSVVGHAGGRTVWGANLERVGTALDPAKTVLEGLTALASGLLPTSDSVTDWKTQFRVITLRDGSLGLVKVYITSSGEVAFLDLVTRGIKDFQVVKAGETLEVRIRVGRDDASDDGVDVLESEFIIVPRN